MKNTEKYKIVRSIFMDFQQFEALIKDVTDGLLKPVYDPDGLSYDSTDKADYEEEYWNEDINDTLSKYFDTKVTSIHADGFEPIGIWITFAE